MGLFKSTKGSIISDYFMLCQDVGQIKAGNMVDVALYDGHLEISSPISKTPVSLQYSQISDVFLGTQTEIIEKNKSVIGRAVAGGLLFGNIGAVVGAASGTGKKEEKVKKTAFIISYTGKDGESHFLTFEDTRHYKGGKLSKKLKELCGINADAQIITEL